MIHPSVAVGRPRRVSDHVLANSTVSTWNVEEPIYYEVSGEGEPLIVLHGAYMTIPAMGAIVPMLAETHRVYALGLQGHGRTTDIDRPITYRNLADDVAAFMDTVGLDEADVFGYSMGAATGLKLAIRHPDKVDQLVAASVSYDVEGWRPVLRDFIPQMTVEMFMSMPFAEEYRELAPNPEGFPALVEKLIALEHRPMAWGEDVEAMNTPVLIITGDADIATLEHSVAMFRLLGGGGMGDMGQPLPKSRLAVLPATSHTAVINQTAARTCGSIASKPVTNASRVRAFIKSLVRSSRSRARSGRVRSAVRRLMRRRETLLNTMWARVHQDVTEALSPAVPARLGTMQAALAWRTAGAGGGDPVIPIGENGFLFVDIMGHGVGAKMIAHAVSAYARSLIPRLEDDWGPGAFMAAVSDMIGADESLVTAIASGVAVKVEPGNRLRVASAGHPLPVRLTPGGFAYVKVGGPLLGIEPGHQYREADVDLPSGSAPLVMSDGLFEVSRDMAEQKQAEENICRVALAALSSSASDIVARIMATFDEITDDTPPDDATVLVIKPRSRGQSSADELKASIDSKTGMVLSTWLRAMTDFGWPFSPTSATRRSFADSFL